MGNDTPYVANLFNYYESNKISKGTTLESLIMIVNL